MRAQLVPLTTVHAPGGSLAPRLVLAAAADVVRHCPLCALKGGLARLPSAMTSARPSHACAALLLSVLMCATSESVPCPLPAGPGPLHDDRQEAGHSLPGADRPSSPLVSGAAQPAACVSAPLRHAPRSSAIKPRHRLPQDTKFVVHAQMPHLWNKMGALRTMDDVDDLFVDHLERSSVALADAVVSPSRCGPGPGAGAGAGPKAGASRDGPNPRRRGAGTCCGGCTTAAGPRSSTRRSCTRTSSPRGSAPHRRRAARGPCCHAPQHRHHH